MRVTERNYLDQYSDLVGKQISTLIGNFDFSENKGGFEYLTKASAVYSLNIEGNSIDFNSYMNYELNYFKYFGFLEMLPNCPKWKNTTA